MTVRRGIIAETWPVAAVRRPSLRAVRPANEGSIFDLFGGAEGQPFSADFDAAVRVTRQIQCSFAALVRVQRPFVLLADLRQRTGCRQTLLADASVLVSGSAAVQADACLRIGRRVTRQADLSQRIGVGAAVSADAALTVYRVILHEDHLILI